ncbi:MAG: 16S rRNA (adenine(1518)-N(6)/adenine(1519)-N(6))-dimethyltransferase RsmA [Actinomycetia bacterium]|nr:16S rRNA (adenine(1518)-N(6)/adenine(1519)-N(6))-dimethyltransferase RsmA [Actinomycetes bacterium]
MRWPTACGDWLAPGNGRCAASTFLRSPDRWTPDPVTHSSAVIRDLLDRHGLSPRGALGQNFVVDPNTVRRIADLAGVGPGDRVVEIGAGLGSLTLALVETGASVTAVETDGHLVPILTEVLAGTDTEVVHADATELDWSALLGPERWTLVANLPYNIATPLVLDLLADVPAIERMLVMVQLEAGRRLVAEAGHKEYGIPSVKVAYHAVGRVVGRVPASVFLPRPRVESCLVLIERRPQPVVDIAPERLFPLVEAAFNQRRKMLRRSLAGRVRPEAFAQAGVDPEDRPEGLDIEAWAALAAATHNLAG